MLTIFLRKSGNDCILVGGMLLDFWWWFQDWSGMDAFSVTNLDGPPKLPTRRRRILRKKWHPKYGTGKVRCSCNCNFTVRQGPLSKHLFLGFQSTLGPQSTEHPKVRSKVRSGCWADPHPQRCESRARYPNETYPGSIPLSICVVWEWILSHFKEFPKNTYWSHPWRGKNSAQAVGKIFETRSGEDRITIISNKPAEFDPSKCS